MKIHVGQNIYRFAQVLVRHMGEIRRGLFTRPSIEIAAPPLDRLRYLQLRAPRRPFEEHMLDKMGNAGQAGRLVPRTGSDEKPERDRLCLARNENDLKAVLKRNKFSFGHIRSYSAAMFISRSVTLPS